VVPRLTISMARIFGEPDVAADIGEPSRCMASNFRGTLADAPAWSDATILARAGTKLRISKST
jgi:hypothetical protein